jgi:tetratricopeptide (TPR) repeat protein
MKETALQYYLDAYSKLKKDHVLEKKIAETFFELKRFTNAYEYFRKLPVNELNEELNKKMILSLMYTNSEKTKEDLDILNISKEQKEYYFTVYDCYSWIKTCVETIKAYSWSCEWINKIKTAILNFEKIQWTDPNSKYALMVWLFLKNKDFLASALIGEETLTKRPNYKSILEITWYSYYEIWNYKKADEYLQKYYNFEPKDIQISYLLWIINFYLENYVTSNLYLNAAVLNW